MPNFLPQEGVCGVCAPIFGGETAQMALKDQFGWDGFRRLVGWVRVLGPTYSFPLDTQTLRLGEEGRAHA